MSDACCGCGKTIDVAALQARQRRVLGAVLAINAATFLLMAGDDHVDGVEQALAYYTALQAAGVPTEMHLYAQGGHAFGLRPKNLAVDRWPQLAEKWMPGLGVLPPAAND